MDLSFKISSPNFDAIVRLIERYLESQKAPKLILGVEEHSITMKVKTWGAVESKLDEEQHVADVVEDYEFFWTIPFLLKNNSSVTAYSIGWNMDDFHLNPNAVKIPDFPPQFSLQSNEEYRFEIQFNCRKWIRHGDVKRFHTKSFPFYLDSIDLALSCKNEKGKHFEYRYRCLQNGRQYNVKGKSQRQCERRLKRETK